MSHREGSEKCPKSVTYYLHGPLDQMHKKGRQRRHLGYPNAIITNENPSLAFLDAFPRFYVLTLIF